MKIQLDDNVVIVRLAEGLATVGLTISNDREGGLRIHNAPRPENVIDLADTKADRAAGVRS